MTMIAVIAVIATIAVIAVIAIIDTSVDAENVVLCIENAGRRYQANSVQLSSCTEWAWGLGLRQRRHHQRERHHLPQSEASV